LLLQKTVEIGLLRGRWLHAQSDEGDLQRRVGRTLIVAEPGLGTYAPGQNHAGGVINRFGDAALLGGGGYR
jgi:hypothetical protein